MNYSLAFHPTAKAEFERLERHIRERLERKLLERLANPHVPAARLTGDLADCYKIKLRKPSIRLVYRVIDEKVLVLVLAVGKREDEEVYRRATTADSDLGKPGRGRPKPSR